MHIFFIQVMLRDKTNEHEFFSGGQTKNEKSKEDKK